MCIKSSEKVFIFMFCCYVNLNQAIIIISHHIIVLRNIQKDNLIQNEQNHFYANRLLLLLLP